MACQDSQRFQGDHVTYCGVTNKDCTVLMVSSKLIMSSYVLVNKPSRPSWKTECSYSLSVSKEGTFIEVFQFLKEISAINVNVPLWTRRIERNVPTDLAHVCTVRTEDVCVCECPTLSCTSWFREGSLNSVVPINLGKKIVRNETNHKSIRSRMQFVEFGRREIPQSSLRLKLKFIMGN